MTVTQELIDRLNRRGIIYYSEEKFLFSVIGKQDLSPKQLSWIRKILAREDRTLRQNQTRKIAARIVGGFR